MPRSGGTRGTCSLIWSATLSFAERVEPFNVVANAAGHLVGLACGTIPATDRAAFDIKARVDMVLQVEQLLLGVQVDILIFFADRATNPRFIVSTFNSLVRLGIGARILCWELDLVDSNYQQSQL